MQALLLSLAIGATAAGASPAESNWTTDYGKALKEARTAGKPLMVVLEDSQTSEQSREVAELTKSEESAKTLAKYHLCKVDVSTSEGKQVAKAFGATEFPYTAVTDVEAQHIVYRLPGRQTGRELTGKLASNIVHRTHKPVLNLLEGRGLFAPPTCRNCQKQAQ